MRVSVVLVVLVCGCTVDVDLRGVPCDPERPCAPGWSCNDGVCMDCVDQNDPSARVQIEEFHVDWTTPGSIQWGWEATGTETDFDHYELVVGSTVDEVCHRRPSVRVWTPDDNPELAHFAFRMTAIIDPVDRTITDGLDPGTPHYASLIAIDTAGRRSVSRIAGDSTQQPASESFVIFEDRLENGWYPMAFELVSDGTSGAHLEFEQVCAAGATNCWTNGSVLNVTPQVIRTPTASELSLGQFSNAAFVQFSISTSTGVRAQYGEVKLGFGTACDLWFLSPFAMRPDGEYREVQIPLRVLTHRWACPGVTPSGEPLTWEEAREGLTAVTVGASWDPGSVVRLDDVQIRW